MKKIMFALLLVSNSAIAEYVPDGCYTAFYDPYHCWAPRDGITQWTQYSNWSEGQYHYGFTLHSIIDDGRKSDNALLSCGADYNNLQSSCSSNEDNRQQWITYANGLASTVKSRDSLIKKLRKACGSKCKKIK